MYRGFHGKMNPSGIPREKAVMAAGKEGFLGAQVHLILNTRLTVWAGLAQLSGRQSAACWRDCQLVSLSVCWFGIDRDLLMTTPCR